MFDKYKLLEFLLFGWVMRSTTKHPKTFETIPRCALVTGSNCKSIVKIHCLGNRPIRHYSNLENIPLLWNSGCGTITSWDRTTSWIWSDQLLSTRGASAQSACKGLVPSIACRWRSWDRRTNFWRWKGKENQHFHSIRNQAIKHSRFTFEERNWNRTFEVFRLCTHFAIWSFWFLSGSRREILTILRARATDNSAGPYAFSRIRAIAWFDILPVRIIGVSGWSVWCSRVVCKIIYNITVNNRTSLVVLTWLHEINLCSN